MKKSIISRKKSKKATLAAGVLAIILGMFPAKAVAQQAPSHTATPALQASRTVTFGKSSLNAVNSSFFESTMFGDINGPTANNVVYGGIVFTYWDYPAFFTVDGSDNDRIVLNFNGYLGVATYGGRTGGWNANPYPLAGMHQPFGGGNLPGGNSGQMGYYTSMFTFENFDTKKGGTTETLNGGVIYLATGNYTIAGERRTSMLGAWGPNSGNNGYVYTWVNSVGWDSYVYFQNNSAINGGAIYNADGTLNLLRVYLGNNTAEGRINDSSAFGGAIYNDINGTLNLNAVHFGDYTHYPTYATTGNLMTSLVGGNVARAGGAIYNLGTILRASDTNGYGGDEQTGGNGSGTNPRRYWGSTFTDNHAIGVGGIAGFGGAILNEKSGIIDISAYFTANTAELYGGAIHNLGSLKLTSDSQFLNNQVTLANSFGGAIFNEECGTVDLRGVLLSGNTAGYDGIDLISGKSLYTGLGGGIYNRGELKLGGWVLASEINGIYDGVATGSAGYRGVSFESNSALQGGGLYALGGDITAAHVYFVTNYATDKGGGIYSFGTNFTGYTASFTGNEAAVDGGAIYNHQGTFDITKSAFESNTAGRDCDGGAIYNYIGTITLADTDFKDNTALNGSGGGVFNSYDSTFTVMSTVELADGTIVRPDGKIIRPPTSAANPDYTVEQGTVRPSEVVLFDGTIIRADGQVTHPDGTMENRDVGVNGEVRLAGGTVVYPNGRVVLSTGQVIGGQVNDGAVVFADGRVVYHDGRGTNGGTAGKVAANAFTANTADISGGGIYNQGFGTVSLDNVSFHDNVALGSGDRDGGGAIFNQEKAVFTLATGAFAQNYAQRGGAIYNEGGEGNEGEMTLRNVDFMVNGMKYGGTLTLEGGAIYNAGATYDTIGALATPGGTLTLNTGTFDLNMAERGGAISNYGEMYLENVKFRDNSATHEGGAIYNAGATEHPGGERLSDGGSLILNGATFDCNTALSGGAIYNAEGGVLEVITLPVGPGGVPLSPEGTPIWAVNVDAAVSDGVVLAAATSEVTLAAATIDLMTITEGTFSYNKADDKGGAIFNAKGARLTLSDAVFWRNEAWFGGGIYNDEGVLTLNNVSFLYNTADSAELGGAIYSNSGIVNINVTTADTAFGRIVAPTDSVAFVGKDNEFNVHVEPGLSLTNRGGVFSDNASDIEVVKTGTGTWRLEGNSKFGDSSTPTGIGTPGIVNFTLEEGILALGTPTGTVPKDTVGAILNLGNDGSLIARNGSKIDAGSFTFVLTNSAAAPVVSVESPIAKTATIAAKEFVVDVGRTGNTTIAAANFDFKGSGDAGVLDFIQPTQTVSYGTPGNGPFLTLEFIAGLPESGKVSVLSDFYVTRPASDPAEDDYIVLMDAKDLGGTALAAFTGNFGNLYFEDGTSPAPFDRSSGIKVLGLALRENDSKIVLTMVGSDTATLIWTGDVDGKWDVEVTGTPGTKNWKGNTGGAPVDTFWNGDLVFFTNDATGTRNVILAENVDVRSMTVTGDNYEFDLNGHDITATFAGSTASIDFGTASIIVGDPNAGRTLTADAIAFGKGGELYFNTEFAVNGDTFLTLNMTSAIPGAVTVASDIHIIRPTTALGTGEIILVESNGTLTRTGILHDQFGMIDFVRFDTTSTANAGKPIPQELGLAVKELPAGNQLVLKMVDTNAPSDDLTWTGEISSRWNVNSAQNWFGSAAGHNVSTFLNDDRVKFENSYIDKDGKTVTVDNKTVDVRGRNNSDKTITTDIRVESMDVTGSGYTFLFSPGSSSSVLLEARNRPGNTDYGWINFGTAAFGNATNGIGPNTTIMAESRITFGDNTADVGDPPDYAGGNVFHFNLNGVPAGATLLTVDAGTGIQGKIGNGDIYVYQVGGITKGQKVTLVDTLGDAVVTNTGELYEDGNKVTLIRSLDPAAPDCLGLIVEGTDSQLVLTKVGADEKSLNLHWTGEQTSDWDARTLTTQGTDNWYGTVAGHAVNVFLQGDSVLFADTYTKKDGTEVTVNNRIVDIGFNVNVGSMTVKPILDGGDNYTFNLLANITAANNIDFNTATIGSALSPTVIGMTITAGGTITFAGGNEFHFDLYDVSSTLLTLNAGSGVVGTIGNGSIYVWNENLVVGDTVVLVDTNTGNSVVGTGPLYIDGIAAKEFERSSTGEEFFILNVNATSSQLLLKKVTGGENSDNLHWTGTTGNGLWDVDTSKNWKGSVAGFNVDTFLNGDTVYFTNLAATANRDVVLATNVNVAGMFVDPGLGYTFTLMVTSAPAIASTGDIDLGNAILKINGYVPTDLGSPQIVVQADGILSGFNPNIDAGQERDFITVWAYQGNADGTINPSGKNILVEGELTWSSTNTTPGKQAHGDFTVDTDFTLGGAAVLFDNSASTNRGIDRSGNIWDGNSLTKYGDAKLTLTGVNTYSGGTKIVEGALEAANAKALGTGDVEIGTGTGLILSAGVNRTQFNNGNRAGHYEDLVIHGDGTLTANPGAGLITTLVNANTGFTGNVTVGAGILRLEDAEALGNNGSGTAKYIDLATTDAYLELAFGGTLNPCSLAGLGDAEYDKAAFNQKITGEGGVKIDAGQSNTVILTNANTYKGTTEIISGSVIVDHHQSLGNTPEIVIGRDGTFTIGATGEFATPIGGDGNVYINPARTETDLSKQITTLTGTSTYRGDTILCSGTTVLRNIDATGENTGDAGNISMRAGTVLEFDLRSNETYNKSIKASDAIPAAGIPAGDGKVVKSYLSGNSVLALAAKNTYTNGTDIYAGTIVADYSEAGIVEALGIGDVHLINEGTKLTLKSVGELQNYVYGLGDLEVAVGAGKTSTLASRNDYTGLTTVTSGTLQLTDLLATGTNNSSKEVRIGGGAFFDIADPNGGTYNKTITGPGTLVKSTDADITLTAANSHQDTHLKRGTTIITNGTALGNGTTTMDEGTTVGFGAANSMPSNKFYLDGSATMDTMGNNATINQKIDGGHSSHLTKVGDGKLTLTQANTFNGLTVDDGRLTAMSQAALGAGAVVNNSELEIDFAAGANEFLRDDITNTNGSMFIKSGTGRMNVDFKFETKAFDMTAGTIGVKLGAGLIIAENGFSFADGTKIIGMADSASGLRRGADKVESFEVLRGVGSNGIPVGNRLFESALSHIEWTTRVNGNSLFYDLWLKSFVDAYGEYLSPNARNAADAADKLSEKDPLLQAINDLRTTADVVQAFTELHGEIYEAAIFAQTDMQRQFNELLSRRRIYCEQSRDFKGFRSQAPAGRRPNIARDNRELWVELTGGGTFRSKIGDYSAYDMGRFGVATGYEQRLSRNFFGGLAFGYDQGMLKLADLPSSDRFDAFRLSLYGEYLQNDVSVFGYFGYAKNWHNVERTVKFTGLTAKGQFNDDVLTAGIDIAKTIHWNSLRFVPSAGLSYVHVQTPYVVETSGGVANLLVHGNNYGSFRTPLGVRVNSDLDIQRVRFTPEFRMFYIPEFGDARIYSHTAFASSPTTGFVVDSGVHGRGGFRIGVGLQAEILPRIRIGVDYDGELWNGHSRHDVGANATFRW